MEREFFSVTEMPGMTDPGAVVELCQNIHFHVGQFEIENVDILLNTFLRL